MKKIKTTQLIILILFGLFLFGTQNVYAEVIRSFDSNITINKDSSILVTETIVYNFDGLERHGIYRDIPVSYDTNKGKSSISLEIIDILVDGQREEYTTSLVGSNKNIKIGKPDVLINGEHTYIISYKVKGALNYFKDFDELYWNMTGNSWNVPIENSTSSIKLPDGVDMSKIESSCYVGNLGSKESCDLIIDGNYIKSNSLRFLSERQGVTIAVGFSKGLVFEPTKFQKIISIIFNNIILFLPIIVFIIMFLVWRKYGKDPKGHSTVIAQYEPPKGIKPTLLGALVNETVDMRDITAGVIYLAEQEYLKINKLDKNFIFSSDDYEIELLKNDISNLENIEKNILILYFSSLEIGKKIKISDLKKSSSFKSEVNSLISDIYKEMSNRGFYVKNPKTVKMYYMATAIMIVSLLPILFHDNLSIFSIFLSGLIIFIFGFLMPRKTKLGAETKDYVLGFKDFLSVTEKDRLDFHNAPEKNPEKFMEFLPYAIALGVEEKWAKKFEGIYIDQPSWYSGAGVSGSFLVTDFVSTISGISTSFNTAAGNQSGSGGGGASGGGGGGGGGGSW